MSRDYYNDHNRIANKCNNRKINNTYQKGKGLNIEYPNIKIEGNKYIFMENSNKMLNNNLLQTLEKPVYNNDMYSSIFVKNIGGGKNIDLLKNLKKVKYKNKKDSYTRYKYVDNFNNQITSGGILFYRLNNTNNSNNKEFLLIENKDRKKYEDFGGCVEDKDNNIYDTIRRELLEESNNIFSKYLNNDDITRLIDNSDRLYNKNNKYLLLINSIPNQMKNIDLRKFGTKENHDNINRVLKWVPEEKLLNRDFRNNLNYRLLFKDFLNYLYSSKNSNNNFNNIVYNNNNNDNNNNDNNNFTKVSIINKGIDRDKNKDKIILNKVNLEDIKIIINNIDLWSRITNKFIDLLDKLINSNKLKYDISFLTSFINNYRSLFHRLENLLDIYLKFSKKLKNNNIIETRDRYLYNVNMTYFNKYYSKFNNDIKIFMSENDYTLIQNYYKNNMMDNYLRELLEIKIL